MAWLNEWAKENTLVRSGTTGPYYWNFDSMDQLYEAYSQAALKKGLCIRSRSFIYFFSQKHKIKFMRYDRYLCPKCDSAKHSEKSQIPSFHEEVVKNQSSYFKQMLSSLSETQCLIVQDYTTIHEDSQSKIRILNLTVYTKSHSGNDAELNVHYVDFIGYMKCNYQVTQYVWDFVIDKLYLHRYTGGVFIWSDNGFKNKMNLYFFLNLQKKVQFKIHCHFFAAYHGHSICDRHFGTGKRKLRSTNRRSLVRTIDQVENAFSSIANTSTYLIDVDPESLPKAPKGLHLEDHIRKYHEWQFTSEGKIICREVSGKGDFIEQQITYFENNEE
jgi:hypothetical protein